MHVLKQRIINYCVRMEMSAGYDGITKNQPVKDPIPHLESIQQSYLSQSGDRMCELESEVTRF